MPNTVIAIENLSKAYRLGQISGSTLTEDLNRWWARARGKPDPYLRIGQADHGNRRGEYIWALKDVSFKVQPGEVLGIIGRNGAGKSTLLKILSRVTAPTSGMVKVKGRFASLLEVGTGFHPDLTGRENIFLNGAILGMRREEVRRKMDQIVDFAEIEQFIDTPVKRYSSGMYVRLAFAVAAHLDPEILLVDEVLAVGDLAFQKKCLGKMGEVAVEGRTVFFVSHNMGAILRLCSRGILLNGGQLLVDCDAESVVKTYIAMGIKQSAEYIQPANPAKDMHLRRVYLTSSSGDIQDEFKFTEGFSINIEYEVNRPVRNCSVWIGIRTLEDIIAFGTADTDLAPSLLEDRTIGYHRVSVTVPGNWLNAGKYHGVIGISVANPKRVFDRVEAVEFSIIDNGTPESISTGNNRPGIFQPFLKWGATE
jgi:lipopolysaccharide transport system ATP-binding protein